MSDSETPKIHENKMSKVIPENILRRMNPKDRAKLPRNIAMTQDEAEQMYSDGQEDRLQADIRQYLNLHDIVFINPSMRKRSALPPGWPDFTFSFDGQACAIEAKAGKNKLDPDQIVMRDKMVENGWAWIEARSVSDVKELFSKLAL